VNTIVQLLDNACRYLVKRPNPVHSPFQEITAEAIRKPVSCSELCQIVSYDTVYDIFLLQGTS